ncbi:unnamed protein product, partial [Timema podura]|nr:unnamed protein product [Timema podura]
SLESVKRFLIVGDKEQRGRTYVVLVQEEAGLEEDEMNLLGMDLLERLEPEDLSELRKHFFKVVSKKHRLKYHAPSGGRGSNYSGLPLTKQDFLRAVDKVLGCVNVSHREHPILLERRKAVQHPGCDERGRNLVGGVPRPRD